MKHNVACDICTDTKTKNTSISNSSQEKYKIVRKILPRQKANKSDLEISYADGQVRPFSKNRLESLTANMVSSAFGIFAQLKYRIAISEFYVNIQEPRGRLVKTIAISFSPRQVKEANELKSDMYCAKWQRCGIITLGRGMTKGTLRLSTPIIAANVKFEYLDFFPNGGSMKGDDGGLLTC